MKKLDIGARASAAFKYWHQYYFRHEGFSFCFEAGERKLNLIRSFISAALMNPEPDMRFRKNQSMQIDQYARIKEDGSGKDEHVPDGMAMRYLFYSIEDYAERICHSSEY